MDDPEQTDVLVKEELNIHEDDQTLSLSIKEEFKPEEFQKICKEECLDFSGQVKMVEFNTDKKFDEEKLQNMIKKEHLKSSEKTDIYEGYNMDEKGSSKKTLEVDNNETNELQSGNLITVHNDDLNCLPANSLNKIGTSQSSNTVRIGQTRSRTKPVKRLKKQFQCALCNKLFATKQNLTRHTFIHSNVRPYKCNLCKKSFTQKCNLKVHALTHSNKRSYLCAVCNKSFLTKHSIRYHIISSHGGQKPYKCNLCQKEFVQKSCLVRHALTHSGRKPHKCSVCGNLFSQKIHLTRHMALTHSGNTIYECDLCKMTFSSKLNVTNHIISVHSENK